MAWFSRRKNQVTDDRASNVAGPQWMTIGDSRFPLYTSSGLGAEPSAYSANRPKIDGGEQTAEAGQRHSVISAAIVRRSFIVSQFWATWKDNDSGNMFRASGLAPFEHHRFGTLLKRAELHIAYYGNAYFYKPGRDRPLRLLEPQHMQIVLGTDSAPPPDDAVADDQTVPLEYALDAEVAGYIYAPPRREPETILPESVAHWRPEPHSHPWLGASWVTSVVREMSADIQADESSNNFFVQGSTPRLVFMMPNLTPEQAKQQKADIEDETAGVFNHWRNYYVGGAADVKVVGASLADLALKEFRGQLHTLISLRSGVPAVMLGIAEAMQGAALMQGNYGIARRQFADTFMHPYMDDLASALDPLADPRPPGRARLSWDPDRVLLMQEDRKDAADILTTKMSGIRQAVDGGFDPDSAVAAFDAEDLTLLGHTGALSVQVQPNTGGGSDDE